MCSLFRLPQLVGRGFRCVQLVGVLREFLIQLVVLLFQGNRCIRVFILFQHHSRVLIFQVFQFRLLFGDGAFQRFERCLCSLFRLPQLVGRGFCSVQLVRVLREFFVQLVVLLFQGNCCVRIFALFQYHICIRCLERGKFCLLLRDGFFQLIGGGGHPLQFVRVLLLGFCGADDFCLQGLILLQGDFAGLHFGVGFLSGFFQSVQFIACQPDFFRQQALFLCQ